MPNFGSTVRLTLLFAGGAVAATCAASASASTTSREAPLGAVIVSVSGDSHSLEFWPIGPGRHPKPARIGGLRHLNAEGIAANGQRVAITNVNEIVLFDVQTKRTTHLADPFGYPLDVAIGKSGALYVANAVKSGDGNVVVYAPGQKPVEIDDCALVQNPGYIAVDNEGDIFINQNALFTGVVEIPNSPAGPDGKHCKALNLHPGVSGYAAGVAIDPKTDDLLVLDDPDYCAGGEEGRLTIYRKPYQRGVGRSHDLGLNCSGGVRLDATSSVVFIGDGTVDGSGSFILEHTYPAGNRLGAFGGGNPGGFTTIPNTLPN